MCVIDTMITVYILDSNGKKDDILHSICISSQMAIWMNIHLQCLSLTQKIVGMFLELMDEYSLTIQKNWPCGGGAV